MKNLALVLARLAGPVFARFRSIDLDANNPNIQTGGFTLHDDGSNLLAFSGATRQWHELGPTGPRTAGTPLNQPATFTSRTTIRKATSITSGDLGDRC